MPDDYTFSIEWYDFHGTASSKDEDGKGYQIGLPGWPSVYVTQKRTGVGDAFGYVLATDDDIGGKHFSLFNSHKPLSGDNRKNEIHILRPDETMRHGFQPHSFCHWFQAEGEKILFHFLVEQPFAVTCRQAAGGGSH